MMSDTDSKHNSEASWICPVCSAERNTSGTPFVSEWAVACHIAGKITGSVGRAHKSWALSKVPNLDVKATMPKIAESLTWAVVEAQRERESLQKQRFPGPYENISQIEIRLHKFIGNTLRKEFGESEDKWWVEGIPLSTRKKCVDRREEDGRRQNEYYYTDLIDLQSIMNNNWRLFEANLQGISKDCKSKNEFLSHLGHLNEIRKVIMHPIRQQDELSEEMKFLNWLDRLTTEFCSD